MKKLKKYAVYPFLCIYLFLIIGSVQSFAQNISGTVQDTNNNPLPGVEVFIADLHIGATTDVDGKFKIESVPKGSFLISFSYIGFKTETKRVDTTKPLEAFSITLHPSTLNLPGITVSASPQPTDVLSSSRSVSVLSGNQLNLQRGESLMQSIGRLPGVSTYSTGSGLVKPVIRGLTSQRVVVLVDGIRQESQQWGDEHAPGIDPFNVERIEVVRGPSSVLYGSDALGGVINVMDPELPSDTKAPKLGADLTLDGYTNDNLLGGSAALFGASGSIGYRGVITRQSSGNTNTPDGILRNTAHEKTDGNFLLGTAGNWGSLIGQYSHFDQRVEILEDPAEEPDATPFQKVQHDKIQLNFNKSLEGLRIEAKGAYQRNQRREFEEAGATDPALDLILNTGTFDLKMHHKPIGPVFGTVGLSAMGQENQTTAEEKLIPRYVLYNFAGFLYEEFQSDHFNLSAGIRFDTRQMNIGATPDLNVSAQSENYNAFSGTLGAVWKITKSLSLSANAGRAWRAPTAFELFVDGVHEGTARYEIGDSSIKPESSLNVETSLKYVNSSFQSTLTVYRNKIDNYIFPNPTNNFDPESGFRRYQYLQANARIYGLEYSAELQTTNWLILNGEVDLLQGDNLKIDQPLPLMPANRFQLGARFITSKLGSLDQPYLSINTEWVADQDRVAQFETTTNGYTLVDTAIGTQIDLGSNKLNVSLQVKNLFDTAYRSHLSRYKEYALNPGRNVMLKINIPFTIAKGN